MSQALVKCSCLCRNVSNTATSRGILIQNQLDNVSYVHTLTDPVEASKWNVNKVKMLEREPNLILKEELDYWVLYQVTK